MGSSRIVGSIDLAAGGPRLSRIVWGAWRLAKWGLTPAELLERIELCLDLGITSFDHADIYGSYQCETLFGEALVLAPALRDRMHLVTKCGIKSVSAQRPEHAIGHYDTGRRHIVESVERSLVALRTERIDLLLIHRPDPFMDADDTAAAFSELKAAGKVGHFGVSNFSPSQLDLLASRLDFPLVTNQIELSVLRLEPFTDGTLDQLQRLRIAPMAWSPLGGGRLLAGEGEDAERLRAELDRVATETGAASVMQVALAWLLAHPARIVPVIGTSRPERIREAAGSVRLSVDRQQWFRILRASTGQDVP